MWISKRRYDNLEKKVAELEKSQLHAITMVKEYIEDQETLSNDLCERVKELPNTIMATLQNNCLDKR